MNELENKAYSNKLEKWTLARTQNANFVYSLFKGEKERIELLVDDVNGLGDTPLVIMRKDFFEEIVSKVEETGKLERFIDRHLSIVEKLLNNENLK